MENCNAIELRGISKSFGDVVANNRIDLSVKKGEILSLLGENGSGKTTLMNMIAGIYYPDEGEILIGGQPALIRSPKEAFDHHIGMIHQHFKLIDIFSAAENVVLGLDEEKFDMAEACKKVREISEKYGFDIDPEKKTYDMSVSEKQTVEIIKVLYRGADILILDEPTAVLTPQETDKLFAVLRKMRDDGKAIIIITHKLNEVLEISDRISVLRKGEYIGTVETKDATVESLTEMMVGQKTALNIERPEPVDPKKRLEIKNINCYAEDGVKVLDDISFEVNGGEILGIAGIAGSGQKELLEAIAGLQPVESGSIVFTDTDDSEQNIIGKTPMQIRKMGINLSFVPEDRLGMGLVGSMGITENMMLKSYGEGSSIFADRGAPRQLADKIIEQLKIITPGVSTPVRKLSGGNVQKVLVGREISLGPKVLMVAYPVRGLDINSSYTIYGLLNEQKKNGVAVIYVGEDLDVLMELCDRIVVMCGGHVSGVVDGRSANKEEIGMLMMKGRERHGDQ